MLGDFGGSITDVIVVAVVEVVVAVNESCVITSIFELMVDAEAILGRILVVDKSESVVVEDGDDDDDDDIKEFSKQDATM